MTNLRQPRITLSGDTRIGEYEPGNGTRYTAVAVRWRATPYQVMGAMGFVSDGWLVVSGNSAKAYLFQQGGYLVDYTIQEHLGGYDGDYPYFGDLVRELIGREGRAARRRDIDTIDEYHDLGMRDLTDPFTKEPQ